MSGPDIDRQRHEQLLQATLAFASSLGDAEDLYRWKLAAKWVAPQPWPPGVDALSDILDELGLGRLRAAQWQAAIKDL